MPKRTTHSIPKGGIMIKGESITSNGAFIQESHNDTCCFGFMASKSKSSSDFAQEVLPGQEKAMMQIFEENLPRYASSLEWVEHYLKLAKRVLLVSVEKTRQLQREFEGSASGVY